jgi:hypothetical protein
MSDDAQHPCNIHATSNQHTWQMKLNEWWHVGFRNQNKLHNLHCCICERKMIPYIIISHAISMAKAQLVSLSTCAFQSSLSWMNESWYLPTLSLVHPCNINATSMPHPMNQCWTHDYQCYIHATSNKCLKQSTAYLLTNASLNWINGFAIADINKCVVLMPSGVKVLVHQLH